MASSTDLRDQTATSTGQPPAAFASAWSKIKLACLRTFFWTYRRGSWQYDVIVIVILAFIFLTPRSWYAPQPDQQVTGFLKNQGIIDLGRIKGNGTYIVDARLVRLRPGQKTEDAVRDILNQRLQRPATMISVDEILDKSKSVIGYTVVVQP